MLRSVVAAATVDRGTEAAAAGLGATALALVHTTPAAVAVVRLGVDAGAFTTDLVGLGAGIGTGSVARDAGIKDTQRAIRALLVALAAVFFRPGEVDAIAAAIG